MAKDETRAAVWRATYRLVDKSESVDGLLNVVVYSALDVAVYWAAGESAYWTVDWALENSIFWAVSRGVNGAVRRAVVREIRRGISAKKKIRSLYGPYTCLRWALENPPSKTISPTDGCWWGAPPKGG